MKAIIVQPDEAAPRLEWGAVPDIRFADDEALVEVAATAVNRADLLQARDLYPPPPGESEILGLEASGRISAVGGKVSDWRIGDRVMALVAGDGYAEKAAVPSGLLMPLPENWTFEQGAAIDALIRKRVCKPPFPHEKAIAIICEGSGTHFDPAVVDAFVGLEETFRNIALTFADCEEEREMLGGSVASDADKGPAPPIEKTLLVEDNEINLQIMQRQLAAMGYAVETAG
jgi:hypothetical protein